MPETKEYWEEKDLKKEKQIAYFNSNNAAISLLAQHVKDGGTVEVEEMQKNIVLWRDFFYKQWQDFYIKNIIKD